MRLRTLPLSLAAARAARYTPSGVARLGEQLAHTNLHPSACRLGWGQRRVRSWLSWGPSVLADCRVAPDTAVWSRRGSPSATEDSGFEFYPTRISVKARGRVCPTGLGRPHP